MLPLGRCGKKGKNNIGMLRMKNPQVRVFHCRLLWDGWSILIRFAREL